MYHSSIYGHDSIKQALIQAQYEKCCFCESKLRHISYGDVEHFRPKAGYRQQSTASLSKPGYYWLAYDWGNLLLSCQLCNQRYKKNLFPLANPRVRAKSHRDILDNEVPLFINPAEENPGQYISYRREMPYSIGNNLKGRLTIKNLGLKRTELREMRWDTYKKLKALFEIIQIALRYPNDAELQNLSNEAQALLNQSVADSVQYAVMARAAIASNFQI
jgi:uncharacterized protein (TIGR02646 family)